MSQNTTRTLRIIGGYLSAFHTTIPQELQSCKYTCETFEMTFGMTYNMTTTTKPINHPGKSWLGEILMKVRNQLRSHIISKEQKVSKIVQKSTQSESTGCSSLETGTLPRRGRTVTSQMRLRGRDSENTIRSTSLSPSRTQSREGVKCDTPLLKDLLRNQIKQSRNQTVPMVTATSTSDHNMVDVPDITDI